MSPQASLHRRTIPKFLVVGAACTLVSILVIFAAKALFEAHDASANFIGYAVGVILNYSLNAKWTFGYRGSAPWGLVRFLVVVGIAYLVNLATVLLALEGLGINGYVAQLLGVPPYAVTSYLLSREFVFTTP